MKHLYFLSLMALMSLPSFAGNNLPQRRLPAVQKAEAGLPGLSSIISSQPEAHSTRTSIITSRDVMRAATDTYMTISATAMSRTSWRTARATSISRIRSASSIWTLRYG